jgi:hypothetical protein
MTGIRTGLIVSGLLAALPSVAGAQAVAFVPTVQTFPNGVTMSTTPVVSADRRYVRLGVSPQFTVLEGIDPFLVPAAVSGGGGGGGLGGGVGGLVGFAGMNGPMAGPGGPTGVFMGGGATGRPAASTSSGGGSSTDFEDRPWPAEGVAKAAPSAAPPPKASGRRGGRPRSPAAKAKSAQKARPAR